MLIRRKISLLLGLLALVMCFQSLDRVQYLYRSAEDFEELAARVEQTLRATDMLLEATSKLQSLSGDIVNTNDVARLDTYSVSATTAVSATQSAAAMLGIGEGAPSRLTSQLKMLEGALEQLIESRRAVLAGNAELRAALESVRGTAQALQALILPFEASIAHSSAGTFLDFNEKDPEIGLYISLNALLTRIFDLSEELALGAIQDVASDVSRRVSASVIVLAQSGYPQRAEVAEILTQVLTNVSGEDGVARYGLAALAAEDREQASLAEVVEALSQTEDIVTGYVRKSEAEIGEVYDSVADASRAALRDELFVNAGLGLGIVLAVWIVFARQISGRLERLTDRVLSLSSGDLSPVERPVGKDELGRMMEALGVFRNTAQELRRSNKELANFAYAASHDLRTPLRAIRDLVDWTLEDHAASLTDEVRSNLVLVRARADRLSRLLQDLLNYARAGHGPRQMARVDVKGVVADIVELLNADDLLFCEFHGEQFLETDETPLRTILLNIIGNSVKHARGCPVRVRVGVVRDGHGWVIQIADNGPGIEKKYQGQVFDLFQTLDSRDDLEASGMGLAMVLKLTRYLDGSVQIVSDPAEAPGTTFILRIPMPDRDQDADTKRSRKVA